MKCKDMQNGGVIAFTVNGTVPFTACKYHLHFVISSLSFFIFECYFIF